MKWKDNEERSDGAECELSELMRRTERHRRDLARSLARSLLQSLCVCVFFRTEEKHRVVVSVEIDLSVSLSVSVNVIDQLHVAYFSTTCR